MVYRRKNYRRRNRRYRKRYPKYTTAGSAMFLAKKALSLINVEKKYVDNNNTGFSIGTTPTITPLSLIAEGITEGTRTGNSVKLYSHFTRFSVQINASATATRVRMITFIDKVSAGSAPSVTQLLTASTVLSALNKDYCGSRFKILSDRMICLSQAGRQEAYTKVFNKLGTHATFIGSGATQADLGTGHVYLLFISDEATNTPTGSLYSRISYIDN